MKLMLRNFYASLFQRHPRQLQTTLALGKKNLSMFFGIIGIGYLQPSTAAVQTRKMMIVVICYIKLNHLSHSLFASPIYQPSSLLIHICYNLLYTKKKLTNSSLIIWVLLTVCLSGTSYYSISKFY